MQTARSLTFVIALAAVQGCGASSSGGSTSDAATSGAGPSDSTSDAATSGAGPSDGGSNEGGSCGWTGTWSVQATPAGFTSGNCASAPPLPDLRIGVDGSLATGDGSACGAVMPSPSTCQTFGICPPWKISLNFRACDPGVPCQAGVVSDLSGPSDGGACSVAITLTRVGP